MIKFLKDKKNLAYQGLHLDQQASDLLRDILSLLSRLGKTSNFIKRTYRFLFTIESVYVKMHV